MATIQETGGLAKPPFQINMAVGVICKAKPRFVPEGETKPPFQTNVAEAEKKKTILDLN